MTLQCKLLDNYTEQLKRFNSTWHSHYTNSHKLWKVVRCFCLQPGLSNVPSPTGFATKLLYSLFSQTWATHTALLPWLHYNMQPTQIIRLIIIFAVLLWHPIFWVLALIINPLLCELPFQVSQEFKTIWTHIHVQQTWHLLSLTKSRRVLFASWYSLNQLRYHLLFMKHSFITSFTTWHYLNPVHTLTTYSV